MTDRCFPFPGTEFGSVDANRGRDYYRERILELSQKCWDHYDNQPKLRGGQSFAKETLVSMLQKEQMLWTSGLKR